jgi:cytochrome c oxidase subunit 2
VPDLGWKKDTIPGFITDAWATVEKPGTYRGQCTELCGRDHGFMPIVVVAKTEPEYQEWLASQKKGKGKTGEPVAAVTEQEKPAPVAENEKSEPAPMNEAVAAEWPAMEKAELMALGQKVYEANCLSCHQANGEGIAGLFPAIAGSAVANGPVASHVSLVLNGKPPLMASFRSVLTPAELAAVVTYQRNALGNSTGDVVQPGDVAKHN